jgi:peptidyl-prolyl cis-trans isomerase A (cyclophilin A)
VSLLLFPLLCVKELVGQQFFDECRLFRVLPNFIAQFGINGDPFVSKEWRQKVIADDPVKVSNKRGWYHKSRAYSYESVINLRRPFSKTLFRVTPFIGTLTFATSGLNSRTSQLFINTNDHNKFLDSEGFAPIGEVVEGMEIVDLMYSAYGEGGASGKGPDQGMIQKIGNAYLNEYFPLLSYFSKVTFR